MKNTIRTALVCM